MGKEKRKTGRRWIGYKRDRVEKKSGEGRMERNKEPIGEEEE